MIAALLLAVAVQDTTVHVRSASEPPWVRGHFVTTFARSGLPLNVAEGVVVSTHPVTVDTTGGGFEVAYTVVMLRSDSTDVWIMAHIRTASDIRAGRAPRLLTRSTTGRAGRIWAQMIRWGEEIRGARLK